MDKFDGPVPSEIKGVEARSKRYFNPFKHHGIACQTSSYMYFWRSLLHFLFLNPTPAHTSYYARLSIMNMSKDLKAVVEWHQQQCHGCNSCSSICGRRGDVG
jgi:hypothetical protein